MKEPDISKNFTVDDIHKIREYNAKKRKNMALDEWLKEIKKSADECEKDINTYKKHKK